MAYSVVPMAEGMFKSGKVNHELNLNVCKEETAILRTHLLSIGIVFSLTLRGLLVHAPSLLFNIY